MSIQWTCSQCGQTNAGTMYFCPACGVASAAAARSDAGSNIVGMGDRRFLWVLAVGLWIVGCAILAVGGGIWLSRQDMVDGSQAVVAETKLGVDTPTPVPSITYIPVTPTIVVEFGTPSPLSVAVDDSIAIDSEILPTSPPVSKVDKLLTEGQFTIEAKKVTQTPTPTPTPKSTPTSVSTATPTPTPTTPSRRTYPLAYSKWDGGAHNLYIADTNGNNEQLILKRAAGPSWSPDMKRLFFYGEPGVDQQIREGGLGCGFGTISDGIVAIDLTASPQDICQIKTGSWFCERKTVDLQSEPSDVCTENGISVYQNLDWKMGSARWASTSPDGEALAFDAKPGGDYRIYFRAMLGTSRQSHFELVGEQGSWSPDGKKMVYRSGRDNKTGLWISNRDDTGHTSITVEGSDSFPAWSPDGRTIAFSRNVYGNVDIYTINVDGTNLTRLTDDPGHDTLPVYTPGGEIIFRSDRTGSWGIWKMRSNGAGQQEIIPNAGVGPDWAYSRMAVGW